MTKKELETYRRRLIELRQRLGDDLRDVKQEALKPTGSDATGGLADAEDVAAMTREGDVALSLSENEALLLREIDAALERTNNGSFGVCEDCGKEIARERLEALPYARYCVPDAAARETPPQE